MVPRCLTLGEIRPSAEQLERVHFGMGLSDEDERIRVSNSCTAKWFSAAQFLLRTNRSLAIVAKVSSVSHDGKQAQQCGHLGVILRCNDVPNTCCSAPRSPTGETGREGRGQEASTTRGLRSRRSK